MKDCRHEVKLVPELVQMKKCIDVPQQICVTIKKPRTIVREVTYIKCWNEGDELVEEEEDPVEMETYPDADSKKTKNIYKMWSAQYSHKIISFFQAMC